MGWRRRLMLSGLFVGLLLSLTSCLGECVACEAVRAGPEPVVVGFALCASEGPDASKDESACLDVSLAFVLVD